MKIIILGNGFDLYSGLKTSYKDFLKWLKLNNNDNIWFKYFDSISIGSNWIDLEHEISIIFNFLSENKENWIKNEYFDVSLWKKNFNESGKILGEFLISFFKEMNNNFLLNIKFQFLFKKGETRHIFNEKTGNSFEQVFDNLIKYLNNKMGEFKNLLKEYLRNEEKSINEINENFINNFLIKKWLYNRYTGNKQYLLTWDNFIIYNFNYTNTFKEYLKYVPDPYNHVYGNKPNTQINFIHGSHELNNIIFGSNEIKSNDKNIIKNSKEFQFLYIDDRVKIEIDLDLLNEEINEILIIGHSISKTDWWFYKDLFNYFKDLNLNLYPEIILFYYSINDKEEKWINLLNFDKDLILNLDKINKIKWIKFDEFIPIRDVDKD